MINGYLTVKTHHENVFHSNKSILDVRDETSVLKLFEEIKLKWNGIDILCANAGIKGSTSLIENISLEEWKDCLDVNLDGVFLFSKFTAPIMKKQQSGRVGIISSVASARGFVGHGGYAASKSAVKFLADSWGYQLEKNNISITTIFPGWIATEMTENIDYKMWFLMDSNTAAKKIENAINIFHSLMHHYQLFQLASQQQHPTS